jgi:hypothetical protein
MVGCFTFFFPLQFSLLFSVAVPLQWLKSVQTRDKYNPLPHLNQKICGFFTFGNICKLLVRS